MNDTLFLGERVRLVAPNPETDAEVFVRWSRDSEFMRLFDSDPARMWSLKGTKEMLERAPHDNSFHFVIRTLADDKLIGMTGLHGISPSHRDASVSIGLGERDYWSKGYGGDAMRVMLHFAFTELNLHRVSLWTFEYNKRAIRSYEKVGFVHEGHIRELLNRDGRRWDGIQMGILRTEWEQKRNL
jgi:RimJ/RimL family protein N-acetyltransferase